MLLADPIENAARPDVSVVIVNWNTRDLLQQTLTTLYRETTDTSFETIVVDNGSEDGSADLVRREWPQVLLITSPTNLGFAAGNNLGFRECRGRYILLLNSDTIILRSTVGGMARFLDAHPEAGCVGCYHFNDDMSLQRSTGDFPNFVEDSLFYTDLYRLSPVRDYLHKHYIWWGDHDRVREVDWVNGACMMVRREVVEQIGGLDEGYFIYAEEVDWCYCMRRAGWGVYFTPEAKVIHLGGKAMDRVPAERIILKYKGQYRFYRKYYPLWHRLILRAAVSVFALVRIALLFFLLLAAPFRKSRSRAQWELLTQETVVTEPATMLRAWWKILWLPW
jgi:N-acetylglucosaminyl-diphospho-decaprenol L-rhamnosyltransferase